MRAEPSQVVGDGEGSGLLLRWRSLSRLEPRRTARRASLEASGHGRHLLEARPDENPFKARAAPAGGPRPWPANASAGSSSQPRSAHPAPRPGPAPLVLRDTSLLARKTPQARFPLLREGALEEILEIETARPALQPLRSLRSVRFWFLAHPAFLSKSARACPPPQVPEGRQEERQEPGKGPGPPVAPPPSSAASTADPEAVMSVAARPPYVTPTFREWLASLPSDEARETIYRWRRLAYQRQARGPSSRPLSCPDLPASARPRGGPRLGFPTTDESPFSNIPQVWGRRKEDYRQMAQAKREDKFDVRPCPRRARCPRPAPRPAPAPARAAPPPDPPTTDARPRLAQVLVRRSAGRPRGGRQGGGGGVRGRGEARPGGGGARSRPRNLISSPARLALRSPLTAHAHSPPLQEAARALAKRLNITLLPSQTSPLPLAPDRPAWRQYNVSFLVLYFNKSRRRAFADTREFLRRLHGCTRGARGDGELGPGATSEVIVNVDSRGEGAEWDAEVERYGGRGQGAFLTVLLSDNLHEARSVLRSALRALLCVRRPGRRPSAAPAPAPRGRRCTGSTGRRRWRAGTC